MKPETFENFKQKISLFSEGKFLTEVDQILLLCFIELAYTIGEKDALQRLDTLFPKK